MNTILSLQTLSAAYEIPPVDGNSDTSYTCTGHSCCSCGC